MTVLQETLNWSQQLPAWQADAIGRLFSKGVLSDDDMDDLLALLKAEHGIPDPKGRVPSKLSADQVPMPAAPNTQVRLLALEDLRYVNKIAGSQRLTFGGNGLTVIYGGNASGKSGYSRVLKHACRARDQSEPIHPDVFAEPDPARVAQATFEIEVNGTPERIVWANDKPAPLVLSSLAVFDSRCARSYLDKEGDCAYVPYGLDILEDLADACGKLKAVVETERERHLPNMTTFAGLAGDTRVGKLITQLSHRTKPGEVEALAAVSAEDESKRANLRRDLSEPDPKEKAKQLRLSASRIARIAANTAKELTLVDDAAVASLRGLADSYQTAKEAAALAARAFTDDPALLPGSGGDAWKHLFEAARVFSLEAYPGRRFPEFGPDERCLLCQQPLGDGAERLRRFEEFVQQQAEKTAQVRREALAKAHKALAEHAIALGADAEFHSELSSLDEPLEADLRSFEAALVARQSAMSSLSWDDVAALPRSPAERLESLADKLNAEARTLERLSDEKARAALQTQLDELEARVQLSAVKEAVLSTIERLDRQAKLTECLSSLNTQSITRKAADLTKRVITTELSGALNKEFTSLGVGGLQVSFQGRGERGKLKLKLELPRVRTPAPIQSILSEGEQRAIAIGSFLAEVTVGGRLGGIIFDDPVCSLDHRYRARVARRLADEGGMRQVIIFTHDLYFVNLLVEEAGRANVPIEKQNVARGEGGFGVAAPDLPFEGMSTKDRVAYLRRQQQHMKTVFGDDRQYRELVDDAYRHLRDAWERAIEEVLFCEVVVRFRRGIQTQRLAEVYVDDSDFATVDRWMSTCSRYCHDEPSLGDVDVPDPEDVLSAINALDDWRKHVVSRRDTTGRKRKSRA